MPLFTQVQHGIRHTIYKYWLTKYELNYNTSLMSPDGGSLSSRWEFNADA